MLPVAMDTKDKRDTDFEILGILEITGRIHRKLLEYIYYVIYIAWCDACISRDLYRMSAVFCSECYMFFLLHQI